MKRLLAAGCLILACALFCSCGKSGIGGFVSYDYFGSQAIWAFPALNGSADQGAERLWSEMKAAFRDIEKSVSLSVEDSAVCVFNAAEAGEEVELDETAYRLFSVAQKLYAETDGAYNPAVGLLVDLWGFSPRFGRSEQTVCMPYDREDFEQNLPEEKYIEAFRQLTDFSKVQLSVREGRYYALKPDETVTVAEGDIETEYTMQLNFGGIGKGYAVDVAKELLRDKGYEYGYVSLGTSSMYVLQDPSAADRDGVRQWEVGVSNPRPKRDAPAEFMKIKINDSFLSTSGDYEQFYTVGGRRYCHIINPESGYPVNAQPKNGDGSGIVCASVFGLPSAAEGDAWTTALIVMGRERALGAMNEKLRGYAVAFVYYDGEKGEYRLYTNIPQEDYRLLDGGLKAANS